MAKAPQDPKEIFQEIISDYKGLFGDDLVAIILYGSATGPDYHPGKSDINFMIILKEAGIEGLDRASDTVKKWRKRKVATPLFLTENYMETSRDVFPIELLTMAASHRCLWKRDVSRPPVEAAIYPAPMRAGDQGKTASPQACFSGNGG